MSLVEKVRANRASIVVGACLVVIISVVWVVFGLTNGAAGASVVALVHDSDGNTYELPLDVDDTLVVETSLGRNVIEVENGEVRMAEADCAHGYCLTQHAISSPGQQIICLPHELWVEIVPQGQDGGQMDEGAIVYDADGDGIDIQAG